MDFDFNTETITPDITDVLTIGGTGGLELPYGTTAQRPATGLSNGALRYNTDLNTIEGYVSNSWSTMATGSTTITLTGDITGSGTSPVTTTLATVNTDVGTFASVTVNGKGLVTAAANLSGDATTSGAVLTLATVNIAPQADAFRKVTVNGKGLVTATSAVTSTDITTALGYTPLNKAGDTMSGVLNMGSNVISNVAAPVAGTDATNKNYVDSAIAGLSWKQEVKVATTVNGTLATAYTNGSTIDGVTLVTGDRILIKNQTTQSENGIYTVNASGAPTRSTDADVGTELVGATVYVDQGTTQANTGWTQNTNAPITLGTTSIVWAQFSGSGSYTAGTGLTLTGNSFALTSPVLATLGGTGQTVYAVGDILFASTTSALSRLADVATGNVLISGGTNTAPSWGKVGLASHVTGTLPIANGGTNLTAIPTNGQLLIGNGTGYSLASLTAGTGITVTPGAGTISIAAVNHGTVTSVGLALPSIFNVTGSPVTNVGTLTGTLANQATNTVFAAPNGGWAGAPTFRTLAYADLPIALYKENPSTPVTPVASAANSVAIGSGSSSTAANSVAIGAGTAANVANVLAYANGNFATAGDAQHITVMLRNTTTTNTLTVLFVDGGSAQRLVMPNNSAWNFTIDVVGRRTDATGGYAMYKFVGGATRDATAATTATHTVSRTTISESSVALNCTVTADTTNGALSITVTGLAAQTFRWVATAEITQVTN